MPTEKTEAFSQLDIEKQSEFISLVKNINNEYFKAKGRQKTYFTHCYGCQQNIADGERINGQLEKMGFVKAQDVNNADVVIYNTCAVREHAEDRVLGNIGALSHNKRRNPDMIIGLCGCMTQQKRVADKIKRSFRHVDFVFGTYALHKLPQMIYNCLLKRTRIFDLAEIDDYIVEGLPVKRDGKYKAWLPIMYGCNNFCTYCIVPYVRGRERSRKAEDIIAEAKALIADGYKEITLLGQNVNSYNGGENCGFPQLLKRISELEGDFRVRFMTSHPKDASKELIDVMASSPKIVNHLHLPVQSGSNRILKLMNRNYTAERYLEIINYAKSKIPDISLTSDIIVGFPGETYEDFCETLKLIEKVHYDALYTFIYSKREGTKAALLEDNITEEEKGIWFRELQAYQAEIGKKNYGHMVGKVVQVLAEGEGKSGEEYITGKTDSNIVCDFIAPKSVIGSFVNVKVTKALNWALMGKII